MPALIVQTDKLPYGKKIYRRGEEFEASEKDAKLLVAIKKARLSETHGPGPTDLPAGAMTRAEAVEEIAPVPEPERGVYKRRDMVAEAPTSPNPKKAPGRPGRPKKSRS